MKLLLKNLPLLLLVQFTLVGATLHLTEVEGEAVCTTRPTLTVNIAISQYSETAGSANQTLSEPYITGSMTETEFVKECKSFSNFRAVFRNDLKYTQENCTGIGDECMYSGSPGCGIGISGNYCQCDITYTFCTETSRSREIEETTTSSKSGDRF